MGTRPLWLAGTVCVPSEPSGRRARSGGGARGASPVHSDSRCDRRPRRALRWTGCAPDQSWKTAPGSPLGPTARFEKQCCGHVATPTRSRACGCFPASPAPPRPAEPVSLLSSGSQSPKCLLLGPLRKSFARRRAHEPTSPRDAVGSLGGTSGSRAVRRGVPQASALGEAVLPEVRPHTWCYSLQCQVLPSPWLLGMSGVLGPRLRPGVYESMWAW